MSAGTMMKAHEAAQMGETLLAENQRLVQELENANQKMEALQARHDDMAAKYSQLKEFEPLLDDAPTAMQIYLNDREVVRLLMARMLKAFGTKNGRHPDTIDKEDEVTRRRARMNFDRVITACLHYGLGPAWNTVYSKYVKKIAV